MIFNTTRTNTETNKPSTLSRRPTLGRRGDRPCIGDERAGCGRQGNGCAEIRHGAETNL